MKKISKDSTYSDFLIYFLDYERNFVKENTYAIYTQYVFKKINPFLGNLKLRKLKT